MNRYLTKIFLSFINIVIFFILHINYSLAENSIITRPESSYIPEVSFFNKEGEKIFLDQFEGKTILVSFWASWCGPCNDEMPSLDILQKDFRKLPFEVIAISEDFNGPETAKTHFNKYGIRHLKLYHDHKNELFKAMSVVGLPTAFLVDPDGKIKVIFRGNTKWHANDIRNIILSEITGNPEMPKNSYISTSLNKKIAPPESMRQDSNKKGAIEKAKTDTQKNEVKTPSQESEIKNPIVDAEVQKNETNAQK